MKRTIRNISVKGKQISDNCSGVFEMPVSIPVIIDKEKCNGCNLCVNTCQVDIFLPNIAKGGSPEVVYPGECWYCGCCVAVCPVQGAIKLQHPLMNRVTWKEKNKLGKEI
jgi:NAD-dependent dihydropyrimidine dehydrogenase PreA subunit